MRTQVGLITSSVKLWIEEGVNLLILSQTQLKTIAQLSSQSFYKRLGVTQFLIQRGDTCTSSRNRSKPKYFCAIWQPWGRTRWVWNLHLQQSSEFLSYRCERILENLAAIRSAKVRTKNHWLCPLVQSILDWFYRCHDTLIVRYLAILHWHIEIHSETIIICSIKIDKRQWISLKLPLIT